MSDYKIDKLKERTTGTVLYPTTLIDAIKISDEDSGRTLKDILSMYGLSEDYEKYSFKINLTDSNPQTRVSYFDMAAGKRPAFWNYTNGYFDYGDWSNAFFIKNMFPCMVKYDGSVDYKLDSENYLLKEDGTNSDISSAEYEGSVMVAFPTIWIKRWSDDNYLYCTIANKQIDEDYHAYMHTDKDGKVHLYKYVGMYFSTLITDRYKSLPNQTYTADTTFADEAARTHMNGDLWEMFSWSDFVTIGDLLTLISKSDNSQFSFGVGRNGATDSSSTSKKTTTDSNNMKNGGMFFNSADSGKVSFQKIFHIHDLYGEQYTRIAGLIYLNGIYFVKPYPPYSTTTENYENLNVSISGTSDNYIKTSIVNEYGRFPTILGGSTEATATTYECDSVVFSNTGGCIARTRGIYNASTKGGKMALRLDKDGSADANTVNRLTCFSNDPVEGA